jgi:predicted metalloprotease with PDZ domain
MLRRAGIWSDKKLLEQLGRIVSRVESTPGTRLMSAVDSSLSAPFIDGAGSQQRTNLANTSVSYYFKGEVIALVLDSIIRSRSGGKASLDDVMRQMYKEFYLGSPNDSYYLRGRQYTVEDVERVVSQVAGTDMHEFFTRYVWGTERLPYETALKGIGLSLTPTAPTKLSLGIYSQDAEGGLQVRNVIAGSIAAAAGISQGDRIIDFGGTKVTSANVSSILNKYKVGDTVVINVKRNRETIPLTVKLAAPASPDYSLSAVNDVPSAALALREAWLTGRS